MYYLWDNYFSDVPRRNFVLIKFGRNATRQLGSITWARKQTRIKSIMQKKDLYTIAQAQDDSRITVITITRIFQNVRIPRYVVDATIAHELVHYTHGFSSPHIQYHSHPHQGGIVRKELEKRGLGGLHTNARRWLKEHWNDYR